MSTKMADTICVVHWITTTLRQTGMPWNCKARIILLSLRFALGVWLYEMTCAQSISTKSLSSDRRHPDSATVSN